MDCVEGRVLWEPALPGMSKAERGAIWDELNRVIALLHGVDYKAVGLEDFGKAGKLHRAPGGALDQAVHCVGNGKDRGDGQPHRLAAEEHSRATDETTVVHGDYRLDKHRGIPPDGSRGCWRCSTGSSRPWAIRSPISPITA